MIENLVCSTRMRGAVRNRYMVFETKNGYGETPEQVNSKFPFRTVFSVFFALIISVLCCHFSYNVFLRAIKALAFGIVAVLFSWDVVYFDSIAPGIVPPSPLSPKRQRESPTNTLHTNYMLAIINGTLFAGMVYLML